MPNSYYIYIKSDSSGGEKPFTPKKPKKPKTTKAEDSFLTMEQIKSLKPVAITLAVAKIGAEVANKVISYQTSETGNYEAARWWSNAKSMFSAALNPVGFGINALFNEQRVKITNQRINESRVLLGDSLINKGMRNV